MTGPPDRSLILPGPPELWVGGEFGARDFTGVPIAVTEEPPKNGGLHFPCYSELRHGGWRPDPAMIDKAVEAIDHLLREGTNDLVRCGSGVERSPAVVATYLARKKGMTVNDAYGLVRKARPIVMEELDLLPLSYEERTR